MAWAVRTFGLRIAVWRDLGDMGDPGPSLERRVDNEATKQRNLSGDVSRALRKPRIKLQELDSLFPGKHDRKQLARFSKHLRKFRTLEAR